MASEIRIKDDTAIVWADTTDYSSTVSGLARTHQLDLTGVLATEARQGAKADLTALRPSSYSVLVAIEFVSAAVSGGTIDIYWAASPSATAGNANPGGTTGADADYSGTAGDSLTDSLAQLQFIGSLVTTSDNTTVVQYQHVGTLSGSIPRYGMPVVVHSATGTLHSDAVEMFVALLPQVAEGQ